jgi:tRNA(Ile2) C34 agmatinyltransferase TiaS
MQLQHVQGRILMSQQYPYFRNIVMADFCKKQCPCRTENYQCQTTCSLLKYQQLHSHHIIQDKPACPRCGCNNQTISRGEQWRCNKCGYNWLKIKRMQQTRITRPNNPCPECHSIHVISKRSDWHCTNCGRYWKKQYRRPPK